MRQIINNTPANSGLGDTLFESMNKINAMTLELYAADSSFVDEIDSINLTLATINDGTSVLNHRHTIAQIQGLQSALNLKVSTSIYITDMLAINASIQAINDTLSDIIVILNTKIEEAPFSGITYGRNNGAWVEISGGTSGLTGLTSTDGSVVITTPSTGVRDLSVAVAASTLSVLVQVRNETGAPLVKGTLVYIDGAAGNKALVVKAQANTENTSNATLGMIQNDIPNNQNGYVVQSGLISGLNTTAYSAGTRIWLSATVAGAYTNVQPSSPNHSVYIGVISRSHVNQGTIEIAIINTQEFRESSDVFLSALTNNDVIAYDSATDLFKNKSIVSALGYTPLNSVNPTYTGLLSGTGITVVTGGTQTGIVDLRQTWSTTGAPTAIKLNITDTASAGTSLLMDLQVGGSSRFSVTKDGSVSAANGFRQNVYQASSANSGVTFRFNGVGTGTTFGAQVENAGSSNIYTAPSGTFNYFQLQSTTFQPTTGNGVFNAYFFGSTINQTGGANGITRGLFINPTLTSAFDFRAIEVTAGRIVYSSTITPAGTTGAQTINRISGKVNAAAGTTSLVVTNNLVTTSSIVMCQMGTNDATARITSSVESNGFFTINYVMPTAETVIKFTVIN